MKSSDTWAYCNRYSSNTWMENMGDYWNSFLINRRWKKGNAEIKPLCYLYISNLIVDTRLTLLITFGLLFSYIWNEYDMFEEDESLTSPELQPIHLPLCCREREKKWLKVGYAALAHENFRFKSSTWIVPECPLPAIKVAQKNCGWNNLMVWKFNQNKYLYWNGAIVDLEIITI